MLFTISLVVYNQLEYTRRCIESIFRHSADFELIITDNASTDGTAEYLREVATNFNDQVRIIKNKSNLGFNEAHNTALEFARGVYLIVLNNDLEVCQGWLDEMRDKFLRDPKLGLCGLAGVCNSLDNHGTGIITDRLEYIEACCLMIPTVLARKEGLFSREFKFGYCEDADLSLRLRERGYSLEAVSLPIRHERAVTAQAVRNQIDIDGFHARNHQVLRTKWARYLSQRNFTYRVGIRRLHAIGDVVMTTPVIRAIKQRWGHAEISVITSHGQVFSQNPDVTHIQTDVSMTTPPGGLYDHFYDLDLAYEREPHKHVVEAYADVCGVGVTDFRPRVYPAPTDREYARDKIGQGRWAAIHPGVTAWQGRDWGADRFSRVATELRKLGWSVVCVGNQHTPPITCDLDLRGQTTFHQLAATLERAQLFIGIDSLPMHLAQAALRPTVAVFGCIDPRLRLMAVPFIRGVTAEGVGCLGCHHILPTPRTSSGCFRDRVYCMERVTEQQVLDVIEEVLGVYPMFLETSKIRERVLSYCTGKGIDIGCGRDKITDDAFGFDDDPWPEVDGVGDASGPLSFAAGTFDYVYSSHCLEDISDTAGTLREWLRILKSGGHIILYVPHPDLYKDVNLDHKHNGFRPDDLARVLRQLGCSIVMTEVDEGPNRYSSLVIAKKETMVAREELMEEKKNPPEFYGREYLHRLMGNTGRTKTRWENNGAFANAALFVQSLIKQAGSSTRVLDVGCGRGWVVHNMRNLGIDAYGVEYGLEAVEDSVCGAEWADLTERLPFPDASFDIVTCLGVLSHLPQAYAEHAVRELARVSRRFIWSNIALNRTPNHEHHRNISPGEWWDAIFLRLGLQVYPNAAQLFAMHGFYAKEQWMKVWENPATR